MEKQLKLKPSSKIIKKYYDDLKSYEEDSQTNEGVVSKAFENVLEYCADQCKFNLFTEYQRRAKLKLIRSDAIIKDSDKCDFGYWEAKDEKDDLEVEIKNKFDAGYPTENIIFQKPTRAILYQHGNRVLDLDLRSPENLVEVLEQFFSYVLPDAAEWQAAKQSFTKKLPQLMEKLIEIINQELVKKGEFFTEFVAFKEICQSAIRPNINDDTIIDMIAQHLFTERIFRVVFNNSDFTRRNVIAKKMETLIDVLTSQSFDRDSFLLVLNKDYETLGNRSKKIHDFDQKQDFMNVLYEKFFQTVSKKTIRYPWRYVHPKANCQLHDRDFRKHTQYPL